MTFAKLYADKLLMFQGQIKREFCLNFGGPGFALISHLRNKKEQMYRRVRGEI